MFQFICFVFTNYKTADRVARPKNRLWVAANQGVPVRQGFIFGQQPVGAGTGQPVWIFQFCQGDGDTVRDPLRAVGIIGTAPRLDIKKPAVDIGKIDLPGIRVFQPVQTALGTAVAQGFPLAAIECVEWFLQPKVRDQGFHGVYCTATRAWFYAQGPPEGQIYCRLQKIVKVINEK